MRRKAPAPAPGSIIIPAGTLAEFIARAVERYGSIRSAADGIVVPYSTLRGWRRRRYLIELTPERSGDALFEHVEAANENAAVLRAHLDAIKRMTGRG
jgi:hypothetical protein